MKPGAWTSGNQLALLENGEEYFPRVFEAIRNARHEVILETFIWFEDEVGLALRDALLTAARAGAQVHVLVDGFGSPYFSKELLDELCSAGVRLRSFDPRPSLLGMRLHMFRRMHRKVVVIDQELGFVGGINFSLEHLRKAGTESKQDYAVEVRGPLVEQIRNYCQPEQPTRPRRKRWRWPRMFWRVRHALMSPQAGPLATFVVRDNHEHPQDIEFLYRAAIRRSEREIIIANAYFFPSWKLLRDLRLAAKRGVRVVLMLQGNPDKGYVKWAASTLYDFLLNSGIHLYEYNERPYHGKVAVFDDELSTVGSSNLDPFSLALNMESNIFAREPKFTQQVRDSIQGLLDRHCVAINRADVPPQRRWRHLIRIIAFHVVRRFPIWSRHLKIRPQKQPHLAGPHIHKADS